MRKATIEEEIERSGSLCYTIKGVSMLPLLHQQQDVVIIKKPTGRLKKYDVALYKVHPGKYVLHRVLRVRDSDYVICGDNCYRREYGITDDNIIGVMDEFVRFGKTISVTSPGYRVYSWMISNFYFIKAPILWGKAMLHRVWHIVNKKEAYIAGDTEQIHRKENR